MSNPLLIIIHIFGDSQIRHVCHQVPAMIPGTHLHDLSIDDRDRVGSICMAVLLHCACMIYAICMICMTRLLHTAHHSTSANILLNIASWYTIVVYMFEGTYFVKPVRSCLLLTLSLTLSLLRSSVFFQQRNAWAPALKQAKP